MSYIGNEPIVSATRTVTEVSATAGQTVFYPNGGYTVGKIDVIVNGAELNSSDFTATNGSSVTLTTACSVGDDVKLVAWGTFTTANIPSGSLTSGAPTWSPTGGVSLPRIDSSTEGGQLNFNRASDDTGNWSIDSYGSGSTPSLRFIDGANVRATIDGSGNVGIGTTSPATRLDIKPTQYSGGTALSSAININYNATPSSSNTSQGALTWQSGAYQVAAINPLFENPSATYNTAMTFYTSTSTGTNTERMRIDSSGNLLVGTTSSADNSGVGFKFRPTAQGAILNTTINQNATTGGSTYQIYNLDASYNGYRFYVNYNGGIVNYQAYNGNLSDIRTKDRIELAGNYLNKICAIPVKLFNYKGEPEGDQKTLGVIAQDVEVVAPELISNEGFGETPEDGIPLKTIYQTDLQYALMKCIQEQQAIITDLKARIETLEGAKIV